MKTPAGIGEAMANIVNINFKKQNTIKLNPTAGSCQYSAAILKIIKKRIKVLF